MTVDELRAAIETADDDLLIWSLFVAHADGTVECHGFDGNAWLVLTDPEIEIERFRDLSVVIGDTPLSCDVVTRVDLLNDCARCTL